MKIIAIIPARGGSKRLPNKNLKSLNKKPLIAHSIQSAVLSRYIDRVIVSTDSKRIARVAKRYGAELPFLRPAKLSGDRTSDYPVIAHTLKWFETVEGYFADIVVWLRPTVPLRAQGLIDRCIETLIEKKSDSVRSVRNVGRYHPFWMLKVGENGFARSFLAGKTIDRYYQHQLLPDLYEHDGYCDVIRTRHINRNCPATQTLKGMYGHSMAVVENNDGRPVINIDSAEDFRLAEIFIANKNLQKKSRAH